MVSVFGRELNKGEFFDYAFDSFVEANYCEPDEAPSMQWNICKMILFSCGWMDEYTEWVANGCGLQD